MKFKKKTFFKIHSWIGIRLSILFFIVCFSGTLATLSLEMDWLFNPASRASPQKELVSRNTIVSNFNAKYPKAKLGYWKRPEAAYFCDIIYKNKDGATTYVFANPYTGEIQGEVQITFQRFFRDLHYYLFLPFQQIGNYMVLAFAFLLLISLVTALSFYKKWWRKLFKLKTGKGSLVFFRSLHRLVGLWSIPFCLLISITGIWYFIERSNIGDVGDIANPKPPKIETVSEKSLAKKDDLQFSIDYERAINLAKDEIPGLEVGDVLPPHNSSGLLYLTGKSDVPLVRQRANRIYVNPYNYELVKTQKAKEIGITMWLNDIADPLHFGSWGGLITKIIWFVFGLAISLLVLSGIWITLKRKAIKRKKSQKKVMGTWRYINWGVTAIIIFFMYFNMVDRYHITSKTLLIISVGWLAFLFLGYYFFVYRLNKTIKKIN